VIQFYVPGKPQGKARARTFYNRTFGRMESTTPEKTVLYENNIIQSYLDVAKKPQLLQGPLEVSITAYFQIPQSTTKKNREQIAEGKLLPTKKPDADNIAKVVCDALNQVAYGDDTQIIKLEVSKLYADVSNPVGLVVKIKEYERN
jgi:Holliday junction resolvase RusA-like endonuclease